LSLKSGGKVSAESVLVAAGRLGNTVGMGLDHIGLPVGERGHLAVNEHYQTAIPHIYAAGDVIGFPALCATSMEQARVAMLHAGGTIDTFIDVVFNYPTFGETYKYAAYDGLQAVQARSS